MCTAYTHSAASANATEMSAAAGVPTTAEMCTAAATEMATTAAAMATAAAVTSSSSAASCVSRLSWHRHE